MRRVCHHHHAPLPAHARPAPARHATSVQRTLPEINARIRGVLDRLGFSKDEKFVVRATGA